jgi:dihydrofolate synthase/folylpolyglutamate synthase
VTIRNLQQANQTLASYVPVVTQLSVKDTKLDRILPLMELLGNPQDKLKTVHIAGTSGKTSTAYFMAALLRAGGNRVGLTVSPHIDNVTERVQLDGKPVSEALFCTELGTFLDIIESAERRPSYFELLYAFAMWMFVRHGVDYAVVETGVGGLLDATNVTTRPDKICVITDIGFDHMHLLGKTLTEIAAQKIGIVHEHNHVFMYEQDEEIMGVVRDWAGRHNAPLHLIDTAEQPVRLTGIADYQYRNWLLAYQVYRYLEERDRVQHLTSQVLQETQSTKVPARMDIRQINNKTLIMDGAHNEQKMTAFINSFKRLYPDVRPAILLSLKAGKEYQTIVPLLSHLASRIIITVFNTSQDLQAHSMDPEALAGAFRAVGATQVEAIADQRQAFQTLLAGPETTCIITGSFYLLGQIRNNENLQ